MVGGRRQITDKGAAVLGAMVATMSSLRVLDVAFNRVTEIGSLSPVLEETARVLVWLIALLLTTSLSSRPLAGAWLCSEWLLVKASRCRLRSDLRAVARSDKLFVSGMLSLLL